MNFLQIKLFLHTASLRSIHKASAACSISPQGASKALALLERELGIPLFKRSHRETLLTKDGEALYQQFQLLSDTYDAILRYAATNASYSGRLTIAAIPRFIDAHLAYILADLYDQQPAINIHIKSLTQRQIYQALTADNTCADFGIAAIVDYKALKDELQQYFNELGLTFLPFYTCQLYACALWPVIRKLGDKVQRHASRPYPTIAYQYDSIFAPINGTYDDYDLQINSISSQLQFINTRQAIGSFSQQEYQMFFDPKKHGRLPYDPPIIQTYGFVYAQSADLSPLTRYVQDFIRQALHQPQV